MLFLSTERYKFGVIEYDAENNSLVTRCTLRLATGLHTRIWQCSAVQVSRGSFALSHMHRSGNQCMQSMSPGSASALEDPTSLRSALLAAFSACAKDPPSAFSLACRAAGDVSDRIGRPTDNGQVSPRPSGLYYSNSMVYCLCNGRPIASVCQATENGQECLQFSCAEQILVQALLRRGAAWHDRAVLKRGTARSVQFVLCAFCFVL